MRQLLIDQAGPLPISVTVPIESNGPAMLFLNGTVWSPTKGTEIGIRLVVDGVELGGASIWSNGEATHRTVMPTFIPFNLNKEWPSSTEPPSYTFELLPGSDTTTSDVNDVYQLSLEV